MNAFTYNPFRAIESLYEERRSAHATGGKTFDHLLASAISKLSKAYNDGERPKLNNRFDRLAYVIQYAPIGMAATHQLIRGLQTKPLPPQFSIFHDAELAIVSVGAGPGTDLFGILMALAVPPVGLQFTRIDIGTRWRTYYKSFLRDFRTQIPEMSAVLRDMEDPFISVDLEEQSLGRGRCGRQVEQADIIILNRVLSTFQHESSHVFTVIQDIARRCANDTLLLILDVSLPRPEFRRSIALAEGLCRMEKRKSEWLANVREITLKHFKWHIPASILRLAQLQDLEQCQR